jgi:hypothetical protein
VNLIDWLNFESLLARLPCTHKYEKVAISCIALIPNPSPDGRREPEFKVPLPQGEGFRVRVLSLASGLTVCLTATLAVAPLLTHLL